MKDLVIFDGDCGICTYCAEYIIKKDKRNKLDVKPYQLLPLEKLHVDLNEDRTSKSLYLLTSDLKLYYKSRAVFEIMKRMPGIYKFFGKIFCNSLFIRISNPFYDLVARNRSKISRMFGMSACNIDDYRKM